MRIVETYSHLNGEEYLLVRKPALWDEVHDVIASVDAHALPKKTSQEKGRVGEQILSPIQINNAFKSEFDKKGWKDARTSFYSTAKADVIRETLGEDLEEQKKIIESAGLEAHFSFNQTDFVKDRVAVEVQLGKYFSVSYDVFVKHVSFFVAGEIDVGIEIIPMKAMQRNMSSGPSSYEIELRKIVQQGRGVPAVPLVVLGIVP